jgi:carboxyl-terminal processing protease
MAPPPHRHLPRTGHVSAPPRLVFAAISALAALVLACGGHAARPPAQAETELQAIHVALSHLQQEYIHDVDTGQTLKAAWDGALDAARRGGADVGAVASPTLAGSQQEALRSFDRAYRRLTKLLPASVDPRAVGHAALAAVASSVHENHTYFIDPDRWSHRGDTSTRYAGIGITIAPRNGGFYVLEVYPNTPAERAGFRSGDRFTEVDGLSTEGMTTDQLVSHLRGQPGTTVSVALARGSGLLEPLLTREYIVVSAFESRVLDDGVGYVRLRSFPPAGAKLPDGNTVPQELDAALDGFERAGVTAWVLDLRNDGGGYLDDMSEIASRLLPKDAPLFVSRTRSGENVSRTGAGQRLPERPLTVIVNDGSASAAEILAVALQESGRARVVGEKSSGVANAANLDALPDGGGLSVTSVETLTPVLRRPLDGQGVTPDYTVTAAPEDAVLGRDRQRDWAADLSLGLAWPAVGATSP